SAAVTRSSVKVHRGRVDEITRGRVDPRCTARPVRGVPMRVQRVLSALCLSWLASCGVEPAAESTAADLEVGALRVRHVLLISIDGMHEVDLARFVADHPGSRLAELAATGVEFSNAWVNRLDGSPSNPSDSFPGLLALTTGGSSPTTGGWYDVSYARELFPDASCAT